MNFLRFANCKRDQAGFSLLELTLVMLVLGWMLCFAIPGWRSMLEGQRMRMVVDQIQGIVSLARQSAVMLHSRVVLCPYQAGDGCGSQWQHGILLAQLNVSSSVVAGVAPSFPAAQVIKVWRQLPSGWGLRWRSSLGKNSALVFQSNGELFGQQGSFYIENAHGPHASGKASDQDFNQGNDNARKIIVSATGYTH